MPRKPPRVKMRRMHFVATGQFDTCPDCSTNNLVDFSFGHLTRAELERKAKEEEPKVSFTTKRAKMCPTCGGTGTVPRMRNTAIPAAN